MAFFAIASGAIAADSFHWSFDQIDQPSIAHGPTKIGEGVAGKSIKLDGRTVIELLTAPTSTPTNPALRHLFGSIHTALVAINNC